MKGVEQAYKDQWEFEETEEQSLEDLGKTEREAKFSKGIEACKERLRNKGKMKEVADKIKTDFIARSAVHSICAYVAGKNEQSEKFLDKFGFEKVGTRKEYMVINGKHVDIHEYYLLIKEE